MGWEERLAGYIGREMECWIEDVSGEKKTEPQVRRLHKLERSEDGLQFYLDDTQFLSVPLFGDAQTSYDPDHHEFVSRHEEAQLIYWVRFRL